MINSNDDEDSDYIVLKDDSNEDVIFWIFLLYYFQNFISFINPLRTRARSKPGFPFVILKHVPSQTGSRLMGVGLGFAKPVPNPPRLHSQARTIFGSSPNPPTTRPVLTPTHKYIKHGSVETHMDGAMAQKKGSVLPKNQEYCLPIAALECIECQQIQSTLHTFRIFNLIAPKSI